MPSTEFKLAAFIESVRPALLVALNKPGDQDTPLAELFLEFGQEIATIEYNLATANFNIATVAGNVNTMAGDIADMQVRLEDLESNPGTGNGGSGNGGYETAIAEIEARLDDLEAYKAALEAAATP